MPEKVQTVDRLHLDIADDDIDFAGIQDLKGGSGACRLVDRFNSQAAQDRQDQRSSETVVFDNQNDDVFKPWSSGHGNALCERWRGDCGRSLQSAPTAKLRSN